MSAKHRCHTCGHRPGTRTTTPITKQGGKPLPSKKFCNCACHRQEVSE